MFTQLSIKDVLIQSICIFTLTLTLNYIKNNFYAIICTLENNLGNEILFLYGDVPKQNFEYSKFYPINMITYIQTFLSFSIKFSY